MLNDNGWLKAQHRTKEVTPEVLATKGARANEVDALVPTSLALPCKESKAKRQLSDNNESKAKT